MELIKPSKEFIKSYQNAVEEYRLHQVNSYEFLDMPADKLLEYVKNFESGHNLPEGWVPSTYLWMVDENEFCGEINIRHALTDALLHFGGNIGYGVRYSKWNQGIGTEMLELALKYAKEYLALDKVLITCNDNNYGSVHVIENNGGILQDKIENIIDGKRRITRRYWINL